MMHVSFIKAISDIFMYSSHQSYFIEKIKLLTLLKYKRKNDENCKVDETADNGKCHTLTKKTLGFYKNIMFVHHHITWSKSRKTFLKLCKSGRFM